MSNTPAVKELTNPTLLAESYLAVRKASLNLCEPLEIEDFGLQAMPDVSPPKWHLAHTTWFFETFLLKEYLPNYQPYHPEFEHLFNSYYEGVGQPFSRAKRGLISRPGVQEINAYRESVDQQVLSLIDPCCGQQEAISFIITLGIQHEQQHQELLLTDIKYNLFQNPLFPAYCRSKWSDNPVVEQRFIKVSGGITEIGHDDSQFAFDNEKPRHSVLLNDFSLASRLTSNADYLEFVNDDGYRNSKLWLSDGLAYARQHGWRMPLYWVERDGEYFEYTLAGLQRLDLNAPLVHVSYYEADAFAQWAGNRLLREAEWEHIARLSDPELLMQTANFLDNEGFHPRSVATDASQPGQLLGDAWEWTQSAYLPHPGFKPFSGSMGEYNGKFMCNQMVLKGGSCVTPKNHIRTSYRNFFFPHQRWQFSGIRLAKD